jgi:hypothetical protein
MLTARAADRSIQLTEFNRTAYGGSSAKVRMRSGQLSGTRVCAGQF